jgi:hypothetical protein
MTKPNVEDQVDDKIKSIVVYASVADFGQVFLSNVNRLYLLAYLLTGDHDMAERCFVTGLDRCIDGSSVFKGWALSWARRAIIKGAIQIISPEPEGNSESLNKDSHLPLCGRTDDLLCNVAKLKPFERCAFVISVLEKLSEHECSLLLRSTRREIIRARRSAMGHLASRSGLTTSPQVPRHGSGQYSTWTNSPLSST